MLIPNFAYRIASGELYTHAIVLEYADEGTLRKYLNLQKDHLKWDNKIIIAMHLTQGLIFIHKNGLVHLDLHSKNVLVHGGRPKISDFGFPRNADSMTFTDQIRKGIFAYKEPYMYVEEGYKRGPSSDVYSLGVLLWEISR
jgi:serine/threonine protein kinase